MFERLFPQYCLGCHNPGTLLCQTCKKELKPHPELCPFCHRVSPQYSTCLNCRPLYPSTTGIIIGFQYTGIIKKYIWKLKYDHREQLADFLAERLTLFLQTHVVIAKALREKNLIITRVPSHWWRRWFVKGYNQSQRLAQQLATRLGVPCLELTYKNKHTHSQAKLTRKKRLANLIGAFQTTTLRNPSSMKEKTVLIIDDITTTGSTINELAETIKKTYPVTQIRGAVIGRHGK